MTAIVPLLAHIGEAGDPWVGVATVAAIAAMITFVLVVFDVVTLEAPGDLLLPLAAMVLASGLGGNLGLAIDEQSPWIVPVGLALLIALVVAAFRPSVSIGRTTRPTLLALAGAVVLAAASYSFLAELWVPQELTLPELEDGVVTAEIPAPPDEDGTFTVRVSVENATLGDGLATARPDDVETELVPRFQVGPVYLNPPVPDDCAAAETCTTAEFEMTLPAGFITEPPETITVELLTADGLPFSPPLQTIVPLPASG